VYVPLSDLGDLVGRKTGIPGLGDIVDFFNPASDLQDILDLLNEMTSGNTEGEQCAQVRSKG
jgi:hypothetical protein